MRTVVDRHNSQRTFNEQENRKTAKRKGEKYVQLEFSEQDHFKWTERGRKRMNNNSLIESMFEVSELANKVYSTWLPGELDAIFVQFSIFFLFAYIAFLTFTYLQGIDI